MNEETLPGMPDGGPTPPSSGSSSSRSAFPTPASQQAQLLDMDLSGTTLGAYRLERRIARGGMGEIYEAMQPRLNRKVAIKVLTGALASSREFLQRFETEARAAAALSHPNVVAVYDFGDHSGIHYLVMELVDGDNLSTIVNAQGKLAIHEALDIISQAVRALKAAVDKAIIHRDIKPSNLLRTRDGTIKVADMGLAKFLQEDSEVTTTGAGIGSPHFLAPEQADDASRVDHRADIYSLGITLLFLLTGRRPFEGASAYSIVLAHSNRPLPTGESLGTPLPPEVESLVQRMAAKNPLQRYQDYDTLLADLDRVRAGQAPRTAIPSPSGGVVAREHSWRLPVALGGAVALILLLIVLLPKSRPADNAAAGSNTTTVATAPPPPGGEFFDGPPPAGREGFRRGGPRGNDGPGRGGRGPVVIEEFAPGTWGAWLQQRFENNRHYPLPPSESTPQDALKLAKDFAGANKTNYMAVVHHYDAAVDACAGSELEAEAAELRNRARGNHRAATEQALKFYTAAMKPLLEKQDYPAVYSLWAGVSGGFLEPRFESRIFEMLKSELPEGARPADPRPEKSP